MNFYGQTKCFLSHIRKKNENVRSRKFHYYISLEVEISIKFHFE